MSSPPIDSDGRAFGLRAIGRRLRLAVLRGRRFRRRDSRFASGHGLGGKVRGGRKRIGGAVGRGFVGAFRAFGDGRAGRKTRIMIEREGAGLLRRLFLRLLRCLRILDGPGVAEEGRRAGSESDP